MCEAATFDNTLVADTNYTDNNATAIGDIIDTYIYVDLFNTMSYNTIQYGRPFILYHRVKTDNLSPVKIATSNKESDGNTVTFATSENESDGNAGVGDTNASDNASHISLTTMSVIIISSPLPIIPAILANTLPKMPVTTITHLVNLLPIIPAMKLYTPLMNILIRICVSIS